jgi:hypothetical protein
MGMMAVKNLLSVFKTGTCPYPATEQPVAVADAIVDFCPFF